MNQFGAFYDEVDGMPRYYAKIMGIQKSKPKFDGTDEERSITQWTTRNLDE